MCTYGCHPFFPDFNSDPDFLSLSFVERPSLLPSFLLVFGGVGVYCWATCWATNWGLNLGFLKLKKSEQYIIIVKDNKLKKYFYLVDVPFLISHMRHLKASAVFLKVQTEQSQ